MQVEVVRDLLPYKQPDIENWNKQYDDPMYRIELESQGSPEDAFLQLIYDRYAVELYADSSKISHIPLKPVDFTDALHDHVTLDQYLRKQTGFQLIMDISGEWTGESVIDATQKMVIEGVDLESFLYARDCNLSYHEKERSFELLDCPDDTVREPIEDLLEDLNMKTGEERE